MGRLRQRKIKRYHYKSQKSNVTYASDIFQNIYTTTLQKYTNKTTLSQNTALILNNL